MPIPGFKSETQSRRFFEAAVPHAIGGPLARTCGAKLRYGGVCGQLALAGETRCLRHGGPDVARRFRERQKARLETGSVSPAEWARAEAKRARNALVMAWRKDPRLPGQTIDLGPDETAFVRDALALGVDVDRLCPALADWLRWRWRRHRKDRPDVMRWQAAVREELPRRTAAADAAIRWMDLGGFDKRTKAGRALKAALKAGGLLRAQPVATALQAARTRPTSPVRRPQPGAPSGPLTRLPVKPWQAGPAEDGSKRALPDRPKPRAGARSPETPPRPPGRPARLPDQPTEVAALAAVLRSAGPQVRAMFDAIARQEDQLRFLRDLSDYSRTPDDAGARQRWMDWAMALRHA